jgi:putative transposase
MSCRYRLYPTPGQEKILLRHCSDARYIWNLCVEQNNEWRPGRGGMPGLFERQRQLTGARADNPWLAEGSATVQQNALHDFSHAMQYYFNGTHGRPSWRKAGRHEGFRITGRRGPNWDARRLNRNWGEVQIPKVGRVRFRWSRAVPAEAKSYRVTLDRAGRWHVAFAVIPAQVDGPGIGEVVGIDRGVTVSAALSTGEMLKVPGLPASEAARLLKLQRKLAKAKRWSNRRGKVRLAIAKLRGREKCRRKDWVEKTSTDIARRFDVIRVEDLKIPRMMHRPRPQPSGDGRYLRNGAAARAGLMRGIRVSGWGLLVRRLEDKAPGRVEKVPPAYTSQRCSACGQVDRESRESQARFRCTACGYAANADVNAAVNIAAGHAVNARGGDRVAGPLNREPQFTLFA